MPVLIILRSLRLIGYLGAVDITTRQFDTFTRLLLDIQNLSQTREDFSENGPIILKEFLLAFKRMARSDMTHMKAQFSSYFFHDGSGSGIEVKNIKFPSMKDLDVSFWFKLNQFGTKSNLLESKILKISGSSGQVNYF